MQVFRSEIRVGLVVLISFILFVSGIFVVSGIRSLWSDKKTLTILFRYCDGITAGAPVRWAGLEVGQVQRIRIAPGVSDRIAVTVGISPKVRVRKDSSAQIRDLGMMGSKYVEISPGSAGSPELPSGATMEGKSPASLSQIIETGGKVASGLVELVRESKQLVSEVRSDYQIKQTIENANALLVELRKNTADLGPIMKNVRKVTGEGGRQITGLIGEVRRTNRQLQRRLGSVGDQVTKTMGQADKGLAEVQKTVKGVRSVVDSNKDNIDSILAHLNETSRNLDALSEDLRLHPWKVVWKGEGKAGSKAGSAQWRQRGRIGPYGKE
ncbi:MAG: MlaD family protein [Syntrophobacteraceae bacterium]|nr:MlaD family protein [Syntrophobacteraceae bacterium]